MFGSLKGKTMPFTKIEYFKGSQQGAIVEDYLTKCEIITPSLVAAELSVKAAKESWNFEPFFNFIKSKSLFQ